MTDTSKRIRRDCLVAVVNNDRDLERFSNERWYRIPANALGRRLGRNALEESEYLALYQTAAVENGLPGAIELWGRVQRRDLVPRREIIPEEPAHPAAGELYHVLRLADVQRLSAPILSRRPRRILYLRTTSERLFAAGDINDLVLGTVQEERLWRELRRGGEDVERRYYMNVNGVAMEVDFAIFRGEHSLGVVCREPGPAPEETLPWFLLRFSPVRLEAEFTSCVQEIAAALARISA